MTAMNQTDSPYEKVSPSQRVSLIHMYMNDSYIMVIAECVMFLSLFHMRV